MQISTFSVARFRSIVDAMSIDLGDITVLIGPNNEGKSNFLKALDLTFSFLENVAKRSADRTLYPTTINLSARTSYVWQRDYPMGLRALQDPAPTQLSLCVKLNQVERAELLKAHKIDSGDLSMSFSVGERNIEVKCLAGDNELPMALAGPLATFIKDRFYFAYVPAIRTEQDTIAIVSSIVDAKISAVHRSEEFKEAVATIRKIEEPILQGLAKEMESTLRAFLPDVRSIRIVKGDYNFRPNYGRPTVQIVMDDGNETSLEQKGDGIKSLVALASFKYRTPSAKASMLAVEEPEAHLHPGAIHELRRVLGQIAEEAQVLVSTHSPAFVAREHPERNLIVSQGTVRMARSIAEVREVIGIRASDNLLHADAVVLVEGKEDARILAKIARQLSPKIAQALDANTLIIEVLGGAGRLAYKASTLRRELFAFFVVLDRDQAGESAIADALKVGSIDHADYALVAVPSMRESEIEDCIDPKIYSGMLEKTFGIKLARASLPGKGKWTARARDLFQKNGKLWSDEVERELKKLVADCVEQADTKVVASPRGEVLTHVIASIEGLLGRAENRG